MARTDGATVALAGDVMLGRLVNEAVSLYGPAYPWGDCRALLADADLAAINLECVIASGGRPWRRTPKLFHFRADPIAIDALRLAGIDAVSLANNHVLDFEVEALFEMLRLLDEAGIARAGAGRDRQEARRPALLDAKGLRIALVAFTDNEPGWAAGRYTPGTNYATVSTRPRHFQRVKAAIAKAREKADLVIFSNHWGPNMRERPSRQFKDFAHAVLDEGADIYFGHSSHIFQGIEVYRGKPLIYDAGDFVDDYAVDAVLRNDQALLFLFEVGGTGVERLEIVPALIDRCQVNRAQGADFAAIAARIQALSAELGTSMGVSGDRIAVDLGSHTRPAAA